MRAALPTMKQPQIQRSRAYHGDLIHRAAKRFVARMAQTKTTAMEMAKVFRLQALQYAAF
jgi:hypothetical protein